MVLSYVRDLLATLTGSRPEPDADGDLLVVVGAAQFYVRVVDGKFPMVQVFSVAVAELEATQDLMVALNEINQNIHFARAFYVLGQVLIEAEMWGADINPNNFQHACANIAGATDLYGPQIVGKFGGVPRFEATKQPEYEQQEFRDTRGESGFYL
jgi:Putative bacterial sensory transduction regulator